MASAVDICNLALSHLGQAGTITSITAPAGSAHAQTLAQFYPLARTTLLTEEGFPWSFALTRSDVLADTTSDIEHWAYRYELPSDVLTIVALLSSEASSDEQLNDFIIEGRYIYTNVDLPVLRYVKDHTDTTKWSPSFVDALARKLAIMVSGTVVRGLDPRVVAQLEKNAAYAASLARGQDALRSRTKPTHKPAWIAKR